MQTDTQYLNKMYMYIFIIPEIPLVYCFDCGV